MKLRSFFIIGLCLSLTACGKDKPEIAQQALLPMPAPAPLRDPGHEELMTSVGQFVAATGAPQNSQFEFTRIDLDDDGRREGIVMMKNPHQYWCNTNGCRMLVFAAHNDGFALQSEIHPVRGPLTVSDNKTNGWRDLVAVVDGRVGWNRKLVAMQFDGNAYPAQPDHLPANYAGNIISDGTRIFP